MSDLLENRICIHVGYGRAASTFLQYVVFPKIPDIIYYGKCSALKKFTFTGDQKYKEEVLNEVGREENKGKTIFFSDEGLIAYSPIAQLYRLKQIFSHAVIILTLRSQFDLILSTYKQAVKTGGEFRKLKHYLSPKRINQLTGHLSYVEMITFVRTLFDNRVEIFLFEEYANDISAFATNLYNIMIDNKNGGKILPANFGEMLKTEGKAFRNQSFGKLNSLVRMLNYVSLFVKLPISRKSLARRLERVDLFLDRAFGSSKKQKEKKKAEERQFVVNIFSDVFSGLNKRLEELLDRKLPENYFG